MAMSLDISDNGTLEDVEMSLQEIRDNIERQIALELDIIWEQIRDLAIEMCPKETGALASSIEIENEGGSGAIGVSGISGGLFYNSSIYAGNFATSNARGEPTALYALFVHDGHALPNGGFHEGVAFLTDAVAAFQDELDACVDRAMSENGWNTQQ
jgi:hypothetical protein